MSLLRDRSVSLRDERGFTLIELMVAMIMATILTMAAVSFLIFTGEDVSHITARVGVDQTGRVALQRVMSELHSSCVGPSIVPIQAGSNENDVMFVSESGEKSTVGVYMHEIVYKKASGTTPGTLTEKTYESTGGTAPNYTWSAIPTTTTQLLTGIQQTKYASEPAIPVFQYYRYYRAGDTLPNGDTTTPYGEFDPVAIKNPTSLEAAYITKVTVSFTVAPEGKEAVSFNHDRPVALEDSATFRLAPASETIDNLPCSEKT
jgi:prepilin-type N-terminal cleavage/methylation domain-containing protein